MKAQQTTFAKIFLRAGKSEPVRRFHPWVFSGAILRIEGKPEDGDIVTVYDHKGQFLGTGHFHHGSIAVRLLAFSEVELQSARFWEDRLAAAWQMRSTTGLTAATDIDCFRLVHGEGDGLSGLIVDVYADTAVLQCHSIGMHRQRNLIAGALLQACSPTIKRVYDKSKESLPGKYADAINNQFLAGNVQETAEPVMVSEHGVRFKVDLETGQKTGFFLDQRENRQLLTRYVKDKTVLNTFCYTGGFSCYALKAGAKLVHSVDISARAMELTGQNVGLNAPFLGKHAGYTQDVLKFLKETDAFYDVLIVDPPAYAKSLNKRHNAVQGYKRLNAAALQRVAPGGIMFTFSCSQVVDRQLFYNTIAAAALEVGRPVSVLHHLTQGPDHPVSLYHPEGSYLKGLVLYVE